MRVAILYDDAQSRPGAPPDERGVQEAVEAASVALRDLGHTPVRVPVGHAVEPWISRLTEAGADLVFNLCEGARGRSAHEVHVAGVVELLGLPMTGSASETLALARRKDRVNAVLDAAGLPVPPWTTVPRRGGVPAWDRFPAIVKPAGEDASVGITQRSVARDRPALEAALADGAAHGTLLVQAFVAGRELAVGFVGDRALPVSEIDFGALPGGFWPIVGYDAKWSPGSAEDVGTAPRCPALLDPTTRDRAIALARAAWLRVEGRGYGRVDLRADLDGHLYILDINPNPDLSPSAGLTRMAAADGWGYVDLIGHIIAEATP